MTNRELFDLLIERAMLIGDKELIRIIIKIEQAIYDHTVLFDMEINNETE